MVIERKTVDVKVGIRVERWRGPDDDWTYDVMQCEHLTPTSPTSYKMWITEASGLTAEQVTEFVKARRDEFDAFAAKVLSNERAEKEEEQV